MNIKNITILISIVTASLAGGLQAGGSKKKSSSARRTQSARPVARRQAAARPAARPAAQAKSSSAVANGANKENMSALGFKTKAELAAAFADLFARFPDHKEALRKLQADIENKKLSRMWVMINLTKASAYLPAELTAEVMAKFGSVEALDAIMKLARA